jgi:branched-chain amino acid transport system permease protein
MKTTLVKNKTINSDTSQENQKKKIFSMKIGDIPLIKTIVILAIIICFPLIFQDKYLIRVAGNAGIWVMLALGLNVVCGFAGLLDLGYVVFWGIGAYVYALLSSGHWGIHLPFIVSLPISVLSAILLGLLVSGATLRVNGDYLGIVTLAFLQIFRLLLLNLDRPINITGGPNGIIDVDYPSILGIRLHSIASNYYLIWIFALLIILFSIRLKNSRMGRSWEAIREDELASKGMGVNTIFMKILAFVTGAGVAGIVGALFASWQGGVFPNNFDFAQLNTIYCMLIIGGIGSINGVVGGALVLAILPEFLRDYGDWRMIGYGLMLVILIAIRPQGLMGDINFRFLKRLFGKKTRSKMDIPLEPSNEYLLFEKPKTPISAVGKKEILKLDNITMQFGGLTAVTDLSLSIREGEIVSLIGPNGAGKTTVFNVITGIYAPTSGSVMLNGESITGLSSNKIVEKGIARTFQTLRLYNKMSVLDNVKVGRVCRTKNNIGGILFRLPSTIKEEKEVERIAKENLSLFGPQLFSKMNVQAGDLSYADRRRLEIVRALTTGAKIILLDEPSAGMNPQETIEIGSFIKRLRDDYGISFLVIEHKLNFVKTLSDYVNVLDYGKKIAEGDYEEVSNDHHVIEAYLGRQKADV